MRTTSTLVLFFFLASLCAAQTAVLVKDIQPGTVSAFTGKIEAFVSIGDVIYFTANDGVHGAELWRSDGTDAGTFMLKDIQAGAAGSVPTRFHVVANQILFFANDGIHGDELWATDGTEVGTFLVKDINPGPGDAIRRDYVPQQRDLIVLNETLFFAADNGTSFSQLWRSDGTEVGTLFLANVCPSCNANNFLTGELTAMNDTLFLVGGSGVWRSDGSVAGTSKIFNFSDSGMPFGVQYLTGIKDRLYMSGGSFNPDLWTSDGTKSGTKLVNDFTDLGNPREFTALNESVFFISDRNLWSTDGTTAGTIQESTLRVDNVNVKKNKLYVWGNEIYYRANSPSNQSYVYKTDGSNGGETEVFIQDHQNANFFTPIYIASNEEHLFYNAINTGFAHGLVKLNSADTLKEFIPVPPRFIQQLAIAGDNLFFLGSNNNNGLELWKFPLLTSSTTQPNHHLDLRLYPTISTEGIFYFDYLGDASETLEVRVFDVTGREVFQSKQTTDRPLRIQQLPSGTYFVRMASAAGKFMTQQIFIGG